MTQRTWRGKSASSLALIRSCADILAEIQPASIRAVCYQLFIRKLIPSMKKTHTNRVSAQLVYAREQAIVPWAWVVDETREAETVPAWSDPEAYADAVERSYRRDRWEHQPRKVEVWAEKGTVRGTLAPVLQRYGVTFRVMHGFASATILNDVAEEIEGDDRRWTVLYIGDWDPSGLYMSEIDIPARLRRYGAARMDYGRVALTRDQIDGYHLPAFAAETKRTDTRHRWFRDRYGDECWELDALSPVNLREAVEFVIRLYIDWESWDRCGLAEEAEKASLRTILQNWKGKSGQAQK